MTAGAGGGPVFVLCTERSGSTLLASCLGASRSLLAPPELHVLRYPTFQAWFDGYPPARASLGWLLRELGLAGDPENLRARFAGLSAGDLYRRVLDLLPPGTRLLDKTPAYSRTDEALARTAEYGGHYVWLVRHPVAVATSRIRRRLERRRAKNTTLSNRLRWPFWLARHHWRCRTGRWFRWEVDAWTSTHHRIRRFLADVPATRKSHVRFEDLVSDPEATLGRLSDELAVDFTEAMLRPGDHVPSDLAWGIGDEKILRTRGIDPAAAGDGIDAGRVGRLPESTKGLLEEFGYAVTRP